MIAQRGYREALFFKRFMEFCGGLGEDGAYGKRLIYPPDVKIVDIDHWVGDWRPGSAMINVISLATVSFHLTNEISYDGQFEQRYVLGVLPSLCSSR